MKKITRRSFLAAAGVSAAALALTACGGSSNSAAASTSTAASSTAASAAGDATAAANDPKVTLVYAEVNPLENRIKNRQSAVCSEPQREGHPAPCFYLEYRNVSIC